VKLGKLQNSGVISMLKRLVPIITCTVLLLVGRPARAQTTPQEVSFCKLANDPKSFDGKMIRVRGTVSDEFEDFSLFAEGCHTQQGIWLAFGGDVASNVPSTVNDIHRTPGTELKVNGVSYGIEKDENFRKFYALITAERGDKATYRVTATLIGAFLAGEQHKTPSGESIFMGYGHLGCCSLFVITKVSEVESVPPASLNLRGTVLGPDGKPMEGFSVVNEVAGGQPQQTTTDAGGHFKFSDAGSVLLFKDPRFRPVILTVEPGSTPVRVSLQDATLSNWIVPACQSVGGSDGRIGFSALFKLSAGLESSPFDDDGIKSYFVFPHGSEPVEVKFVISTGTGPVTEETNGSVASKWSDKWSKRRWIKDVEGKIIGMDSRGQLENGEYWRQAIFLDRDSAYYSVRSHAVARSMNQIIDSVCIAKP